MINTRPRQVEFLGIIRVVDLLALRLIWDTAPSCGQSCEQPLSVFGSPGSWATERSTSRWTR
ncbi:hypothetical protein LINPERHAP1_LOCUS26273 [Linum perenne]